MTRTHKAVNHQLMHKLNRSLILSSLRKCPAQTRAELAERTGMTRSTVSNLVDELIDKNFIHEVGYSPSRGGRRGKQLELNPSGGCAIALKIGTSAIHCILTNFVGDPLWEKCFTLENSPVEPTLEKAEALIHKALEYNNSQLKLLGIGVGVTGIVGHDGTVQQSVHLGWDNVTFRERWEEKYSVPVSIGNEVSFAALGENYYGSALNDTHFVYIEVGYGVGAGIVIDGKLFRGVNGYAGEVGFMMMNCNAITPWEGSVNIPAVLNHIQRRLQNGASSSLDSSSQLNFQAVTEALNNGDQMVVDTMISTSQHLGVGIASMVNILDVPLIILGGELGKLFEPYLPIIREQINHYAIRASRNALEVRISTLQPDACLMGAIAQVLDDILQEPSWQANL
ncbi:MAG: ROK family transcriptional regulator [Anaerolineae bacterium]|nr:ROK family transcriptional regulator [Anaerolineae bacterium]